MVDPVITLYSPDEEEFQTNGLGSLIDASACRVTEEGNGEYELRLDYPITGQHFQEIKKRSIIFSKPTPYDPPQPFRVYDVSKPIKGIVSFSAAHISYDLRGKPISPFTANYAVEAVNGLKVYSVYEHPFTFWTDVNKQEEMKVEAPTSTRTQMGEILNVYGGEYEFDRFSVKLHSERGEDRGVSIRYGKNLTDLQQEENCSNTYTGVYPYWKDAEGNIVQLPEKVVECQGTYDYVQILPLDLSSEFREAPTVEELRNYTISYIQANGVGIPEISIDVSFVALEQTEDYKDFAFLEKINLFDTVSVEFPEMGVSAKAKCVKTEYDVLTNRYIKIHLGDARTTIVDTMVKQQKAIEQAPTKNIVWTAIDHGTAVITGNKGGYAVMHDSDGDGKPDELLFLDQYSIEQAVHLLRINKSGIGFSSDGYDGPYDTAWTLDGHFNAKYIDTGTLTIGGVSNSPPVLRILNTSGQEIGRWDVDGIRATVGRFDSVTVDGSTITGSSIGRSGSGANSSFTGNINSSTVSGSSIGSSSDGTASTFTGEINSSRLNSCTTNGTSLTVPGGSISSGWSGYMALVADYGNNIYGGNSRIYVGGGSALTNCPFTVNGSLTVTGDKDRVIATLHFGKRLLSAFETPIPTFSDYGTAVIGEDGVCYITIDPIFSETINDSSPPVVFLTSYGQGELYVDGEKTTNDILVVRGTPNLRFSWETRYKQTNSYDERLRVMDSDYKDLNHSHDFVARAYEDLERNRVDYAQEGYNYYTNFEKELTS